MLLGKDYWPGKCGDSDKPSGVKVQLGLVLLTIHGGIV